MSDADRYLADLRRALPRGQRRRIIAEIRGHLSDGIAAEVASGADPDEAERLTVERLGPPEQLAAQFASTGRRTRTVLMAAVGAAVLVALFSFAATHHASNRGRTASTAALTTVVPTNDSQRRPLQTQLEQLRRTLVLINRHRVLTVTPGR